MAFVQTLTDGGTAKLTDATATTIPINVTKWRIGPTPDIVLNPSLTDVVGGTVDSGTVAELQFDIVADDQIIIRVILDESRGDYVVGNIGLFTDDDTMITIGTFDAGGEPTKQASTAFAPGNRFILNIPITFTNVGSLINFNLITNTFASWPWVEDQGDLPPANTAPFEGYTLRNEPGQGKAITAIRDETAPGSGIFQWSLDYHNRIDYGTSDVRVDSVDGPIILNIAGSESARLATSGNFGIGTSTIDARLVVDDGADGGVFVADTLNTWESVRVQIANTTIGGATGLHLTSETGGEKGVGIAAVSTNVTGGACEMSFMTSASNVMSEQMKIDTTGHVHFTSGTFGAPALTFFGDLSTGIYRPTGGSMGFSSNGALVFRVSGAGAASVDGDFNTPGYFFINDSDCGMYRKANNSVSISAGGFECANFTNIQTLVPDGGGSLAGMGFISDPDTGFRKWDTNHIAFYAGGSARIRINTTGLVAHSGHLILGTNSLGGTVPAFSFDADTDTGISRNGANDLGLVSGGNLRVRVTTGGMYMSANNFLFIDDGDVSAPGLRFANDPSNGLYLKASNSVSVSAGGVECANFTAGQTLIPNGGGSLPGLAFIADPDTGILRWAADHLAFYADGSARIRINTDGLAAHTGHQLMGATSQDEALPSFAFDGDDDSGMFRFAEDTLAWATNGVERLRLTTTALQLQNSTSFQFPDGTLVAPSISFVSTPGTGFSQPVGGGIDVSVSTNFAFGMRDEGLLTLPTDAFHVGPILDSRFVGTKLEVVAGGASTLSIRGNNVTGAPSGNGTEYSSLELGESLVSPFFPNDRKYFRLTGTVESGSTSYNSSISMYLRDTAAEALRYKQTNITSSFYAHDLEIGHEDRRGTPGRALVDDTSGELAINYSADWAAGVRIDSALKVTGIITAPDGNVTLPAYSFTGNPSLGMYRETDILGFNCDTEINWKVNATLTAKLTSVGFQTLNGLAGTPSYSFTGNPSLGMFRDSDILGFNCDTEINWRVGTTLKARLTADGLIIHPGGSAGTPGIRFNTDSTAGIYYNVSDGALAISDNSSDVAIFDDAVGIRAPKGVQIGSSSNNTIQEVENITKKYAGLVNSGGATGNLPAGWGVVNAGTAGVYTVTHGLGVATSSYGVVATANSGGSDDANVSAKTTTTFNINVIIHNTSNPTNQAVAFELTVY